MQLEPTVERQFRQHVLRILETKEAMRRNAANMVGYRPPDAGDMLASLGDLPLFTVGSTWTGQVLGAIRPAFSQ